MERDFGDHSRSKPRVDVFEKNQRGSLNVEEPASIMVSFEESPYLTSEFKSGLIYAEKEDFYDRVEIL